MDHELTTFGAMLIFGVIIVALLRSRGDSPGLRVPKELPPLPEELSQQVRSLLAQRKTIEAVKIVREKMNVGLKEAKDIVDSLAGQRT